MLEIGKVVQQMEEQKLQLESDKNREITELKERIAELMFKKTLFPVTEQLTQTPYSKKVLDSQRSQPDAILSDVIQPDDDSPTLIDQPDIDVKPDPASQQVSHDQQTIAMEIQSGLNSLMNLVGQLSPSAKDTFSPSRQHVDLQTPVRNSANATSRSEAEFKELSDKLSLALKEAEEAKKRENDMAVQWNLTATKFANEEKARKELQQELEKEQEKVVVVQRKSLEMEKTAGAKVAAIEEVRKELFDLQKELSEQHKKSKQQMESTSNEITALQAQHQQEIEEIKNSSNEQLAESINQVKDLKKQLTAALSSNRGDTKKLSRAEEDLEKCKEQIENLESDKKRVSDELREKKQEVKALKKEVSSLKTERTQTNIQLKKAEKKSEHFEKRVAALADKPIAAREQVKELKQKLEQKDEEMESLKSESTRMESQVKLLKKEVEDLRLQKEVTVMAKNIEKIKRSTKEEQDGEFGEDDEVTEIKKRKTHPHIILSGFREKRQVTKGISALGGTLLKTVGDNWDNRCTHMVIASHDVRTMKTIAAALTHKWVMPKIWVTDSVKAGKWLDEKKYGYILKHEGVSGKAVHMTDAFCLVGGSDRIRTGTQLVELGKGTITENIDAADIVLRAPVDGNHFQNPREYHMTFTWEGFISWIFPTTWKPPISLSES
eukprot:TRINITY_DN2049_c0_g1_i1.p1 TRINITY_DN2049_c0_g1~~TRINITY_DN2049_c0_g1_i1.p1  ORF type:complete len:664 (+),score=187.05 TRINITY_DN2049_c0_g1_i1:46-2037(+)